MTGALEHAASRLRAAVEKGDFGPALAGLPEWRRELDQSLAGAGMPAAAATLAEARSLLEWARRVTLCRQALLAAQLEALACTDAYAGARPARRSWQMEG